MESLKVVSMNVNGFNMGAKRRIIFDHLRQSKADIALLQETHATSTIEKMWEKEWGGSSLFQQWNQKLQRSSYFDEQKAGIQRL